MKSLLLSTLVLLAAVNPLSAGRDAGPEVASQQTLRVDFGGQTYRLELTGSLAHPGDPFEARLFRLDQRTPDAVWSVTPRGSLTDVTIRIGADQLTATLLRDVVGHRVCGPYAPPVPEWVELNGIPVDVSGVVVDVEADSAVDRDSHAKLLEPETFFQGFARLQGVVLTALGPPPAMAELLTKGRCQAPCMGCAGGILRVSAMTAAMTMTCSSVGVTAGTTLGGCLLAMVVANSTVIEAGVQCASCNSCYGSQHGPSDDVCDCPCEGEPLCDCTGKCPPQDDEGGGLPGQ